MENDTEGPFYPGYEIEIGTILEIEDINEKVKALPNDRKTQFIHEMIEAFTISEIANVLDEIAIRLDEIQ